MRTVVIVQKKFIFYTTIINFYLVFLLLFFTVIYLYTVAVEYKIARALQSPDDYGGMIGITVEILISFIGFAIGVVFYVDLCDPMSFLHLNMRLICHSLCIDAICVSFLRILQLPEAFSRGSMPMLYVQFISHARNLMIVQNAMNPILLAAERYCATRMVKIYEHRKSGNIAFYGICVSWLISSLFYYFEVQAFEMNNPVNIVICNCSLSIIILLTIFFYLYLYQSNLYHYAQTIAKGSLSERYQTAENIRFLRAITESAGYTLAINVFILASFSVTVMIKLGRIDKQWSSLNLNIWEILLSLTAMIPLPFFKLTGRFKKMKTCLCGSERSHSRTRGTVTPSVTTNMATPGTIQSVTGREVPLAATQAEYFNIFNSAWK